MIKVLSHMEGSNRPVHLKGEWKDSFIEDLPSGTIALMLNYMYGFRGEDLSFVAKIPRLKTLSIVGYHDRTYKNLSFPPELESVQLDIRSSTKIDFSNLKHLKSASLSWNQQTESILLASSLEVLWISHLKCKDLLVLDKLRKLNKLSIVMCNALRSFAGIENHQSLTEVSVHYARQLTDISELHKVRSIQNLTIEKCPRISSYDVLADMPELKRLEMRGSAPIEDLSKIAKIKTLTYFDFALTLVKNGDIGVLLNSPSLKFINFENKRHYTHTVEQWRAERSSLRTL